MLGLLVSFNVLFLHSSDSSPIRHEVPDLLERWTVALVNYCSALGVDKVATLELLHSALYGQSHSQPQPQPEKDAAATTGRAHQKEAADPQAQKASKSMPIAIEHTATAGALPAPEAVERFITLEHFEYYFRNAQLNPPINDQCALITQRLLVLVECTLIRKCSFE